MIDMDKMVEVVAEAICNSHPERAHKWDELLLLDATNGGFPVASRIVINTRKQAKAAIKAFCKELPPTHKKTYA